MFTGFEGFGSKLISLVQKIESTFVNEIGDVKTGSGTGFLILTRKGSLVFATNKHNLDPALKFNSSYSFGGSSGSPIFSYPKGIKVGPGLQGGGYVEPRLLGIMSGIDLKAHRQTDCSSCAGVVKRCHNMAMIAVKCPISAPYFLNKYFYFTCFVCFECARLVLTIKNKEFYHVFCTP